MVLDNTLIPQVLSTVKVEEFYDSSNKEIFKSIVKASDDGLSPDLSTMAGLIVDDELRIKLVQIISESTYSPTHLNSYLKVLKNLSDKRKILQLAEDLTKAVDTKQYAQEIILEGQNKLLDIYRDSTKTKGFAIASEHVDTYFETFSNNISKGEGEIWGLSTGFSKLDSLLGGLKEGELFIIGALPGVGKTAFLLNVLQHISETGEGNPIFFSAEMGANALIQRMALSISETDAWRLQHNMFSDEEMEQYVRALGEIANSKIIIDDTPSMTTTEMMAKSKLLMASYNVNCWSFDFADLFGDMSKGPEYLRVGMCIKRCKQLARTSGKPFILLSQLSRPDKKERKKGVPRLSDLRQAGEQEADLVLILQADLEDEDLLLYGDQPYKVNGYLVKNRNGARGKVSFQYTPTSMVFEEI